MRDAQPGGRRAGPHPGHMHRAVAVHSEDEAQVVVLEVLPVALDIYIYVAYKYSLFIH